MNHFTDLKLLIAGTWVGQEGRQALDIVNPATGGVLGQAPVAGPEDIAAALESSATAYASWREISAFERSKLLRRWGDIVRERARRIAETLTMEQGKPLAESLGEVLGAADIIDWFAEEGRRAYGRIIPSRLAGHEQLVVREPVGPAALFTTWNFPASGPCRKIASALAAGCSAILKPAEETPATAIAIVTALVDAGAPAGLINLVLGNPKELADTLIGSPIVRAVSFTGSTTVGRIIGRLAGENIKPATLELGGHSPVLIFNDVDVENVVQQSVAAKFRNAGQVCMAPTRFYVQNEIYDRFVEGFIRSTQALKLGDGLNPETTMGPLADRRRVESMEFLLRDAIDRGAVVRAGGSRADNLGYFFQPTVICDVSESATVMCDEPFGPIAIINRFQTIDQALSSANSLPYALAAYGFVRDTSTATAISRGLDAGVVAINSYSIAATETPFGGRKDSGYGLEGGLEGLNEFTMVKSISRM